MLKRAESRFRSSIFGRMLFIYAAVLIAFFSISAAAQAITLYVELETGERFTFDVDPYKTKVMNLKAMISEKTGIAYDHQKLVFRGQTLTDISELLYIYGIKNNYDTIYLLKTITPPGQPPHSEQPKHSLQFFRLCDDCVLPATGFSSLRPAALPEQPKELRYTPVGVRLMIPSIEVDSELVRIPRDGDSWSAEWLDKCAGILEGSALPGEGLSVIAGHNTLNDTEYGPFALLGMLEENDMIAAVSGDGSMKTFYVYASLLLDPDDTETMAVTAEREENTLVLVTCENESAQGGYLNRRAVFAKPAR